MTSMAEMGTLERKLCEERERVLCPTLFPWRITILRM